MPFNDSNYSYWITINISGAFKTGTGQFLHLNDALTPFNYAHARADLCDLRPVWANSTDKYEFGIFIQSNNSATNGISEIQFNSSNVTADGGGMRLYYGYANASCVSDIKNVHSPLGEDFPLYGNGTHAINSSLWTYTDGTLINDSVSPADYLNISNWTGGTFNEFELISTNSFGVNQSELIGEIDLSTTSSVVGNDIRFGFSGSGSDTIDTLERTQNANGTCMLMQYSSTNNVTKCFSGEPSGSFYTFRLPYFSNSSTYYANDMNTLRMSDLGGDSQMAGPSTVLVAMRNVPFPQLNGTRNGTTTNDNTTWTTPVNIGASDNAYATASHSGTRIGGAGTTAGLNATNFSFAIPSEAVISGIKLEIEKHVSSGCGTPGPPTGFEVLDRSVFLTKNNAFVGNNKALAGDWGGADSYASYGNSSELWGTTWTPAEINDNGFGAYLSAYIYDCDFTVTTANVDHMRITVYYTMPRPWNAIRWLAVRSIDLNLPYPNATFIGQSEHTISACGVLTSNYTLGKNEDFSSSCFYILQNDLTLDCAGFSITGAGTYGTAVEVQANNTHIKNCILKNSSLNINSSSSFNLSVENTTASNLLNLSSGNLSILDSTLLNSTSLCLYSSSTAYLLNVSHLNGSFCFDSSNSNLSVAHRKTINISNTTNEPAVARSLNISTSLMSIIFNNVTDANGQIFLNITQYKQNGTAVENGTQQQNLSYSTPHNISVAGA
ncbi:MAG: hypothetical protein WC759_00005, partial [Candidatus Micrarchaeia archaeon]